MSDVEAKRDRKSSNESNNVESPISNRGSSQRSSVLSSRSSRSASDNNSGISSSLKEKVARAIVSGKRTVTPDQSMDDIQPYTSPNPAKKREFPTEGSPTPSKTMLFGQSPSHSTQADDKVKSPALSIRKEEGSPNRTRPITSPKSGPTTSPYSGSKLKSPSLPDRSKYTSDLSIYASASEDKGHDINNSSADVDLFYSVENSPGEFQDPSLSQLRIERQIPEHEQPGFSVLDDIILHKGVAHPDDEFNDIIRDHMSNYGNSSSRAHSLCDELDGSKGGTVFKKAASSHNASVDLEKEKNKSKDNTSDTLESIPLTKESDNNEDEPDGQEEHTNMENAPILPKRHVLLLLLFLGFAVVYSLRVNINVAIVAMVNNKTRLNKNGRIEYIQAEFNWNSHSQALVVGAFYYGYWVLQVPGAWIAMKLGATRIFGYGVLLSSLLALVTPVATRYHLLALVGVRVAQGLVLGVTYPCVIAIWANWAPPLERSTMVTITMAGSPVGNIIAIPITGILAKYGFDGGWPSVFYFFGSLGVLWYIVWELTIYDKPENHPGISMNEKMYIEKSIGSKPFDPLTESLPWVAIMTSVPMWAIIIGHFGACWGYYTLFTQMPTYLKDVQHLDIKTMGLVASTPYLLKAFLGPVGGIVADMLLKGGYLSVRTVRIIFYGIGCLFAGFFILMTGYYSRKGEAIAFLILGVGFSGLNTTGYAVNHLDLAPRYAGILMGISNTFATIPGFLSPMVTGFITKHKRASEWKIVFWITFIVYVIAVILYSLMCSGEKQWWFEGYPKDETDDEDDGDGKGSKKRSKGKDKTSVEKSDYGYEMSDAPRSRRSSSRSRKGSNVSARSSKRHSTSNIDKVIKSPISRRESNKSLPSQQLGSPTMENTSPVNIRKPSYSEIVIPNEETQINLTEKAISDRESDKSDSPISQHSSLASKAFSQYLSPESRQGSASSKHSATSSLGKGAINSTQLSRQGSNKSKKSPTPSAKSPKPQKSPTPSAKSQTSIKSAKSEKSISNDEATSRKASSIERDSHAGSPIDNNKDEVSSPKRSLKSPSASPDVPRSPPKSTKSSPDHSDYEILSDKESPRLSNNESPKKPQKF